MYGKLGAFLLLITVFRPVFVLLLSICIYSYHYYYYHAIIYYYICFYSLYDNYVILVLVS